MKILVTGGAGFIGGNFVHHMVNKYPDYEIVNLDLLTYAGNLETLKPVEDKPNYKFVKGDIADREFIMDLFEKEKCLRDAAGRPCMRRKIFPYLCLLYGPHCFLRKNISLFHFHYIL